ncbi:hypothetical protein JCM3770_000328 [Rhodotorula araucariae]
MAYAGSHTQAAFGDDVQWATYPQAPPDQFTLYDTRAQQQQYLALDSSPTAYLEASSPLDAPPVDPLDSYAYTDATYTYAPQRSYSYGTTPSPALPALSPASSASASSPFSGLVSPHQHTSTATTPDFSGGSRLLPPAHVQDGRMSVRRVSPAKSEYTAGFAEMQESYLQRYQGPALESLQDAAYYPPSSPAFTHRLPPPPVAVPPSTPRRQATSSSHLYRSPSALTYSSSSSVSSPYHRPTTPRSPASYPSDASRGCRGSTGGYPDSPAHRTTPRKAPAITTSVDANGSPTKSIRRRVARLSIEVPPPTRASLSASLPPTGYLSLSPRASFASAAASAEAELSEASVREVEQLLGELGPILESGGYEHAAVASSPMMQARTAPTAYDPGAFPPTTISISGVTLAEEDLRFLDDPSLCLPDAFDSPTDARAYPQSAPAWRTSFDLPPPPPPMQSSHSLRSGCRPIPAATSYTLTHLTSVSSLAPSQNPHVRAYSAQGSVHQPRDYAQPPLPAATARRRRSSVDSAALAAAPPPFWPSGTANYRYHPAFEPRIPGVLQPVPPADADFSRRPVTPPPRTVTLAASVGEGMPATPAPSTPTTTPKRKRGSPTKAKQPVAMFVNYSAQDAKKLLNGVAPSGSTKKRREEEDAFRLLRANESALPSVLAPPPLPFATG